MSPPVMWVAIAGIAGGVALLGLVLWTIRTWGLGKDDQ